jgi:hypothetical protein
MGLLMDIRSGKAARFGVGAFAIIFWLVIGGGLGSYATGGSDKAALIFGCVGAATGLCIGAYAAFGNTRFAKVLATPGWVIVEVLQWCS